MTRHARRIPLVLVLLLATCALWALTASAAFAVGEDIPNAADLDPRGASITTSMVVGSPLPTGHYFFRVPLEAGETFKGDFTSNVLGLKALRLPFMSDGILLESTALAPKTQRLVFTAKTGGMYNIQVQASTGGTFTVTPSIVLTTSRIKGDDRIGTALAVAKKAYPGHSAAAVIAFGYNFPDALAAGPLAEAYGGPVLLTATAGLRNDVIQELKDLAPSTVFIVGSDQVVGTNVETQLGQLPSAPEIIRLGGGNRFETAAKIADQLKTKAGTPDHVVVVNGYGYADALSAAPLASAKHWPILLTQAEALPPATRDAVTRSGAGATLIVGSTTVVSDTVMNALPGPVRKGGGNRYETCALVADFATANGCSFKHMALATGENYPDALSAGPYLAMDNGLLLLTRPTSLPDPITQRLSAHKADGATLNAIGSTGVVSDGVVAAAQAALQ